MGTMSIRMRNNTRVFLSGVMLLSCILGGCTTSTQPPSNVTRETYPMPETEGYVWASDPGFNDLSTAEQLELISYDTLIEDDYYSGFQEVVIGPDGSRPSSMTPLLGSWLQ